MTSSNLIKRKSGIYAIVHTYSGMMYVGSAVNLGARLLQHFCDARRGSTMLIHRAMREFGFEAFDFEVLCYCSKEDLLKREGFYISFFNSASTEGFNTRKTPLETRYLSVASDATRERMSKSRKGTKRIFTEAHKKAMSEARKGIKWTEAHRAAMIGRKRKPCSAETKEKIRAANKGKQPSALARQKSIEACKGKPVSAERREKLRIANVGKKMSPESIAKSVASRRGWKMSEEQRLRLSEKAKTSIAAIEWRKKLALLNKGRHVSEESRAKMRISAARRKK